VDFAVAGPVKLAKCLAQVSGVAGDEFVAGGVGEDVAVKNLGL
jgi:hypothetical protein